MGKRRREIHGPLAFVAWLGVHAMLMTGVRTRVETFIDWCWAYFSQTRGPQVLDRAAAAQIDWDDDGALEPAPADAGRRTVKSSS
jgi:NADH dehydrogenase